MGYDEKAKAFLGVVAALPARALEPPMVFCSGCWG
jgi:hypothetical protein